MPITLNGSTGVTAAAFDGALDATDLTGNVDAARITNALNATGSAPIYACRAWVNFNGATPTIRSSGNVSSVTSSAVGVYVVNFNTAMSDANYSAIATTSDATPDGSGNQSANINSTATGNCGVRVAGSAVFEDPTIVSVAIFR